MSGKKEDYFFEPDKLPKGERVYYERTRPILEGLLADLKSKGCLRRTSIEETKKFVGIMKDKRETAMAFNRLTEIFDRPTRLSTFLENNREYFTDEQFSYLYMSQSYFIFLVHIEMFKSFLLFYLKRGASSPFRDKMTLGPFLTALKKCSPKYGRLIEKELALDLRNAFAHGLFQIGNDGVNPVLIYYEDLGKLDKPTSVSLVDLLRIRKNHNILYVSLAQLAAEKMTQGFFREA